MQSFWESPNSCNVTIPEDGADTTFVPIELSSYSQHYLDNYYGSGGLPCQAGREGITTVSGPDNKSVYLKLDTTEWCGLNFVDLTCPSKYIVDGVHKNGTLDFKGLSLLSSNMCEYSDDASMEVNQTI